MTFFQSSMIPSNHRKTTMTWYIINRSPHQKCYRAIIRSEGMKIYPVTEFYVSIINYHPIKHDASLPFLGFGFLPFGVLLLPRIGVSCAIAWLILVGQSGTGWGKLEVTNRGMLGLDGWKGSIPAECVGSRGHLSVAGVGRRLLGSLLENWEQEDWLPISVAGAKVIR